MPYVSVVADERCRVCIGSYWGVPRTTWRSSATGRELCKQQSLLFFFFWFFCVKTWKKNERSRLYIIFKMSPKLTYSWRMLSQQKSHYAKEEQLLIAANTDAESIAVEPHKPSFATSFFSQSLVLGHRNMINILRTPELFFSRVGLMVCSQLTTNHFCYSLLVLNPYSVAEFYL